MNKGELIEAVAAELGGSKTAAQEAVNAVVECITKGVKTDEAVSISGFGTFSRRERKARMGRNPSTGAPLEIKASTTVGFKPSQALKDSMVQTPVAV